jgi:hypothetical protein
MNPALSLLIAAIIRVESHGNSAAVGTHGELGPLQIRPAVVEDVNLFKPGAHFTLDDRAHLDRAIAIFRAYIDHYADAKRLGHEATLEDIARIWNGGPNGWCRACTLPYWAKVRNALTHRIAHE